MNPLIGAIGKGALTEITRIRLDAAVDNQMLLESRYSFVRVPTHGTLVRFSIRMLNHMKPKAPQRSRLTVAYCTDIRGVAVNVHVNLQEGN